MSTPGTLYIVATPIGNLDDLSPRAQQILKAVDTIAAEDTRHSRYLLTQFGIQTSCISLHEHNEQARINYLLTQLKQGLSLAVISDAGTPLISDPGYRLVQAAREQGVKVVPIPGPCALVAALSVAGLPSDRFIFEGFLPAKNTAKQKQLAKLKDETRTVIFYEAPHRILDTISAMISIFGDGRQAVIARELTKTFETVYGGTLAAINQWLQSDPNQQKGEFVILLHGAEEKENKDEGAALAILDILLSELPVSQAAKLAAKITGEKKSWFYEKALERQQS